MSAVQDDFLSRVDAYIAQVKQETAAAKSATQATTRTSTPAATTAARTLATSSGSNVAVRRIPCGIKAAVGVAIVAITAVVYKILFIPE